MDATLDFIKNKIGDFIPEVAVVLGSGLGSFADDLDGIKIDYKDIPNFKTSDVKGHNSRLIFSEIEGKNVVIMQGRLHFYEGHSLRDTTYPIKIMKKLGVKTLILSNAAGGINPEYEIGDIVLIKDHINMLGSNPLIGRNDDSLGQRFPDMSCVYCQHLRELVKKIAPNLKDGVYLSTTGPSYETPSEIKMFRILGADLVGMSTVPEAIVANYCSIKVLAFSLVTNLASGISKKELNHKEVVEIGKLASKKFNKLVKEIIREL